VSTDDAFRAEPPTLFLTDDDVAELADWDAAIAALREAYSRPEDPRATPEQAVAVTTTGWQRVMASAPPGAGSPARRPSRRRSGTVSPATSSRCSTRRTRGWPPSSTAPLSPMA
jgi:hypothetical protein